MMDRLFLWIFTVAVLVGTAGIILQVVDGDIDDDYGDNDSDYNDDDDYDDDHPDHPGAHLVRRPGPDRLQALRDRARHLKTDGRSLPGETGPSTILRQSRRRKSRSQGGEGGEIHSVIQTWN